MKTSHTNSYSKSRLYYNHVLPGSSDFEQISDVLTGYKIVQAGATVAGDHKSPNQWWYEINDTRLPLGSARRTEKWVWGEGDPMVIRTGFAVETSQPGAPLNPHDFGAAMLLLERADSDAYQRLTEDARGSLDLSIDAFQLRQNAKMLNVLKRVDIAAEKLRWFPPMNAGRLSIKIAKQIGGKWLEWVYGIKPIMEDIHGIAEETLRYNLNKTVKVKGRRSLIQETTPSESANIGGQQVTVRHKVKSFAKVQYILTLKSPEPFELDRLTSLNPVSIAYELIPFSFVVDWFYDIGGLLRGTETALLYQDQFVSGYKTTVWGYDASYATSGGVSNPDGTSQTASYSASRRYRNFHRSILGHYPFPRTPVFKTDLSSGRLLNAAALLSQFTDRRFGR